MSDKTKIDLNKISIVEFKLLKGQIETPEEFSIDEIKAYQIENTFQIGFNIQESLVKTDFTIDIKSESEGGNDKEATGSFHIVFIFEIKNVEELAKLEADNSVTVEPELANLLSALTYSSARGILLTRLQGTSLQNFILPIINPDSLLQPNEMN